MLFDSDYQKKSQNESKTMIHSSAAVIVRCPTRNKIIGAQLVEVKQERNTFKDKKGYTKIETTYSICTLKTLFTLLGIESSMRRLLPLSCLYVTKY